jgi:hypothetical protein
MYGPFVFARLFFFQHVKARVARHANNAAMARPLRVDPLGTRATVTPEGAQMEERKRELIEPNEGDKRFIRRDEEGKFTEDQVDVSKSLSQDSKTQSKTRSEPGHGDKGDR